MRVEPYLSFEGRRAEAIACYRDAMSAVTAA